MNVSTGKKKVQPNLKKWKTKDIKEDIELRYSVHKN